MAITLNGTTGITTPDVDSTDLTATGNFTSRGIDDNATSTAMTLDTSGNVGIGNSNPSAFNTLGASDKLVIGDSTDSNLTLFGTTYGSLAFADSDTSSSTAQYAGLIQYYHADNSMQFYTNSSERMRITTDKVQFNVDAKVDADNSHDLGSGGARWKDLYLSGGVYLGGTGAANHLDDYEEGTWEPTLSGATLYSEYQENGIYGCTYTKIGRLVILEFKVSYSYVTSANALLFGNLPFSSRSGIWGGGIWTNGWASEPTSTVRWWNSGTNIQFYESNGSGGADPLTQGDMGVGGNIFGSIIYYTA